MDHGRRATSSRCPARSTQARTRSNATSRPNGCWGCREHERAQRGHGDRAIAREPGADGVRGHSPRRNMRFGLTDDQLAFRDAVRDLLAKEPNDERATWDALVEMGVTTVLVPESDGGLGL